MVTASMQVRSFGTIWGRQNGYLSKTFDLYSTLEVNAYSRHQFCCHGMLEYDKRNHLLEQDICKLRK
jgi:hypothetical protein